MSLVSEALRKARQEAAERGEKQRGASFRTTVVLGGGKPGRRIGWGVLLAVAAAGLAGAAVAWWVLTQRNAPGGAAVPVAAAPIAPAGTEGLPSATAVPGAPSVPVTAAAAPPAAPAAAPSPGPTVPAAGAAGPASRPAAGGVGASPPPAPATATIPRARPAEAAPAERPPRPAVSERAGERSFVLEADLGKVKLHLDYIVYRSKGPFAAINGQEVVIGSIVEGFVVEEIGPESVRLAGPGGAVLLKTH
ncbi:MAG TPA: hypothetical protein VMT19_06850 [Thermoanaerobaculaceae bacterium]|nr:hypothetical protein [Thermoanaerobaculaceae bacterium]